MAWVVSNAESFGHESNVRESPGSSTRERAHDSRQCRFGMKIRNSMSRRPKGQLIASLRCSTRRNASRRLVGNA